MINSRTLRYNLLSFVKRNIYLLFIIILFFVTGIISGSISVKVLGYSEKLELINFISLFFNQINQFQTGEQALFRNTLALNFKYIISIWLLAISIIGSLLIPVILFLQAFFIGFTVSFLLDELFFSGLLFSIVAILPHNIFLLTGIILASLISLSFVKNIIKVILENDLYKLLIIIKQYMLLMLLTSIFFIIAAFIESIVVPPLTRLIINFIKLN